MLIVLLIIGITIIVFSLKSMKKESGFSQILSYEEKKIDDVDVRIGKLRREFSETILDLQLEIEELKEEISNFKSKGNVIYNDNNLKEQDVINEISIHNINKNDRNYELDNNNMEKIYHTYNEEFEKNSVKIEQIRELCKKNISVEEIAEKLEMGKGEVLLIKELYIK